jgi:hypothetical protein
LLRELLTHPLVVDGQSVAGNQMAGDLQMDRQGAASGSIVDYH